MSLISRIINRINIINKNTKLLPIISINFHTTKPNFAGHSKWANIKHTKALKDNQKSQSFTRLARQIRLAIQEGGSSNPEINTPLKNAIDGALRKSMPMSSIQNTIKKCELNKNQLKKYLLEIRALNKIYMVCILYTDNFPALKMNLAPLVRKAGAIFTDSKHLFEDRGAIEAKIGDKIKEKVKTHNELEELCTEDAIESGAEEIEIVDYDNGLVDFFCNPIDIDRISGELTAKGYTIENAEHLFTPKVYTTVPENDLKTYQTFLSKLRAFEGIEEVYDNLQPMET